MEIDIVRWLTSLGQEVPAAIGGAMGALLVVWVYLKRKFSPTTGEAKDDAEANIYRLLTEDNKRLSNIVANMSKEIQEMKQKHSSEIEDLQKQLFAERLDCFAQMQALREKVEALEAQQRRYNQSN